MSFLDAWKSKGDRTDLGSQTGAAPPPGRIACGFARSRHKIGSTSRAVSGTRAPSVVKSGALLGLKSLSVANYVADEYIKAVWKFLHNNPKAEREKGTRYLHESATGTAPWCADQALVLGSSLQDISGKTFKIEDQSIQLASIVSFVNAQSNREPRWWHPHQTRQHNFVVVCPAPYQRSMQLAPKKDPMILIFDPWFDLLPRVYTTEDHLLPTHTKIMEKKEQFSRAMYYWKMQPYDRERWRRAGFPSQMPPPRPRELPYTPRRYRDLWRKDWHDEWYDEWYGD